jgi:hypothetical protein
LISQVWREALLRDNVAGDTKRLFEIGTERHQIEEAPTLRHVDKEIKIAGVARLSSADRTENADAARAMSGRNPIDVVTPSRGKHWRRLMGLVAHLGIVRRGAFLASLGERPRMGPT